MQIRSKVLAYLSLLPALGACSIAGSGSKSDGGSKPKISLYVVRSGNFALSTNASSDGSEAGSSGEQNPSGAVSPSNPDAPQEEHFVAFLECAGQAPVPLSNEAFEVEVGARGCLVKLQEIYVGGQRYSVDPSDPFTNYLAGDTAVFRSEQHSSDPSEVDQLYVRVNVQLPDPIVMDAMVAFEYSNQKSFGDIDVAKLQEGGLSVSGSLAPSLRVVSAAISQNQIRLNLACTKMAIGPLPPPPQPDPGPGPNPLPEPIDPPIPPSPLPPPVVKVPLPDMPVLKSASEEPVSPPIAVEPPVSYPVDPPTDPGYPEPLPALCNAYPLQNLILAIQPNEPPVADSAQMLALLRGRGMPFEKLNPMMSPDRSSVTLSIPIQPGATSALVVIGSRGNDSYLYGRLIFETPPPTSSWYYDFEDMVAPVNEARPSIPIGPKALYKDLEILSGPSMFNNLARRIDVFFKNDYLLADVVGGELNFIFRRGAIIQFDLSVRNEHDYMPVPGPNLLGAIEIRDESGRAQKFEVSSIGSRISVRFERPTHRVGIRSLVPANLRFLAVDDLKVRPAAVP